MPYCCLCPLHEQGSTANFTHQRRAVSASLLTSLEHLCTRAAIEVRKPIDFMNRKSNMPNDWAVGSPASARRFACDRCRGQKLRCLREGQGERCDRCVRANADCVTSPPFRMGRPPGHNGDASSKTDSNGPACSRIRAKKHQDRCQRKEPPHASLESRSLSVAPNRDPNDNVQFFNAMGNSFGLESTTWPTSIQDWESQQTYTTHSENVQPALLPQVNFGPNHEELDLNYAGDMNMDDLMSFENLGTFSPGLNEQCSRGGDHGRSDEENNIATGQNRSHELAVPEGQLTSAPDQRTHAGESSCKVSGSESLSKGTTAENEDSYINRLSNLSLKLATKLGSINGGPPSITLDTLLSPTANVDGFPPMSTPVDQILGGTREFVEILASLKPSTANTPSSSSSRSGSMRSEQATSMKRTNENRGSDNSRNGRYSPDESIATSPSSILSTTDKNAGVNKEPHLDITVLLQALTCYVHLVRLYVVLFSHIETFLNEIASSDDPFICPLPQMTFSQLPLRECDYNTSSPDPRKHLVEGILLTLFFHPESGNLQAMILIQIVTHFFDKIEKQLGLTQENRLSGRGGHYAGLLSDEDYARMVKVVTRKEEIGEPDTGRGGIKCLRKLIKRAKQLLKESIAP